MKQWHPEGDIGNPITRVSRQHMLDYRWRGSIEPNRVYRRNERRKKQELKMYPRERLPYSAIEGRTPLRLPDGLRLIVWPVLALEEWDLARAMARYSAPFNS